jgi:hypothetical protein
MKKNADMGYKKTNPKQTQFQTQCRLFISLQEKAT